MKYNLITKKENQDNSILEQVLINRGIPADMIYNYVTAAMGKSADPPLYDYKLLGEIALRQAATTLIQTVAANKTCMIVVDVDDDGYTSASLLINYLYCLFPAWTNNKVRPYIHQEKQHGLQDCVNEALNYDLVICPDSASSDKNEHSILAAAGIPVICLDHHLTDIDVDNYPDAIIINSQCRNYPNKELSGVGVTWKFCQYLDELLSADYSSYFLDLVAQGLIGDMMSFQSFETRYLVAIGLQQINNLFFKGMIERNEYSLRGSVDPTGIAFYIVPSINAVIRCGNYKEKELVFYSMLDFCANRRISSTKRGAEFDSTESLLEQAVRICANAKNRQTRTQDMAVESVKEIIKENDYDNYKIVPIILRRDENIIKPEIRGLIANKLMAEYCKPCFILTESPDGQTYSGSARGCLKSGINDFKALCESTGKIKWAQGHENAFGLAVQTSQIQAFIDALDAKMPESHGAVYDVDAIYDILNNSYNLYEDILLLSSYKFLWGQQVEEPLVAIQNIRITKKMIDLLSRGKNPTLKIRLDNGVELIKFGSNEEEYESLRSDGYVQIDVVGTCELNVWGDKRTPQIKITDYEVTNSVDWDF